MWPKLKLINIIVIALLIANIYQVYHNRMLKKEMLNYLNTSMSTKNLNENLIDFSEIHPEEYFLQKQFLTNDFLIYDINDNEVNLSEIINKNVLVLYIDEISCTECNVKKLKRLIDVLKSSGIKDIIVLANFESHAEFKQMVIETNLDIYPVYNSTLKLRFRFVDNILLFYYVRGEINFPFVVDDNSKRLVSYLNFLNQFLSK